MTLKELQKEWNDFKSKTKEEIVDLSMSHIFTLKEYMDVQISGEEAEAHLRDIDVLTEKEKKVRMKLPAWAVSALREATFCLKINGEVYIPTQYVVQRNLRDLFGLSGGAVSGNGDRMARDKYLASLFKEKGLVKFVSGEKRQGIYTLKMIKANSKKDCFHADDIASIIDAKYKVDFERNLHNAETFCFTAYIPTLKQGRFILGIRVEDSFTSRTGIFVYIVAKDTETEAVFYLDSRSRGHKSSDSAEKFFTEIEAALLNASHKKLSLSVDKEQVLKYGYAALKARKRVQLRIVLENNLYDSPLLSAYHAIANLFPPKDYSDVFYDAGKSKFLLALGGVLAGVDVLC